MVRPGSAVRAGIAGTDTATAGLSALAPFAFTERTW